MATDVTGRPLTTMADIKFANKAAGHFWFSRDTIRFFESKVYPNAVWVVSNGTIFVSSEQSPYGPREWKLRIAYSGSDENERGHIDTVSGPYAKMADATAAGRDYARFGPRVSSVSE